MSSRPNGVFIVSLTHDYYLDIARTLSAAGVPVKAVAASRREEYRPKLLNEYLATMKPDVFFWEDMNTPERFEAVFDPDYSVLGLDAFADLAYYEKIFLLMSDRVAFHPLSQLDRCRLFYRYIAHFHNIVKRNNIDAVIFFNTPHGPWSIALWGLAKALKLEVMYTDQVGLSTDLATIETEITIRRSYTGGAATLGRDANAYELDRIRRIIHASYKKEFSWLAWLAVPGINVHRRYLKAIASLILKWPFSEYVSSEFFLNKGPRQRIRYAWPLFRHYLNVCRLLRFYDRHTTDEMLSRKSVVLFMHQQPEASTMPNGGVFADQLLLLDLILAALPKDMDIYVKEHPWMFDTLGEDRHERSVDFYRYLLRDPRVKLLKRSVPSEVLIRKAGAIVSTIGSVSWEAMLIGRPCVVFGWAWFAACASCFVVDSVDTLRTAIEACVARTEEQVRADVETFLAEIEKRTVYAASSSPSLRLSRNDYDYRAGVRNLSRALALALGYDADWLARNRELRPLPGAEESAAQPTRLTA